MELWSINTPTCNVIYDSYKITTKNSCTMAKYFSPENKGNILDQEISTAKKRDLKEIQRYITCDTLYNLELSK
jgi:hypothetical protein